MEHAVRLGGPDWFKLGDKDLGTHLERTRRLNNGQPLSKITRDFCKAWKVQHTILPMSDQPVRTIVETVGKEISFQEYFVHLKCEPKVIGFHFEGAERAEAAPGVVEAIDSAEAVVICPSNPWVSIDPILAVANLRSAVEAKLTIAVSPIIGGKAVKGPLAKMFTELGIQPSALAIIEHYQNLLNGFVLDNIDQDLTKMIGIPSITTDTLMDSLTKRAQLAQAMLHFMRRLL